MVPVSRVPSVRSNFIPFDPNISDRIRVEFQLAMLEPHDLAGYPIAIG
jgi:hypothetical protein